MGIWGFESVLKLHTAFSFLLFCPTLAQAASLTYALMLLLFKYAISRTTISLKAIF